MQSSVHLDIVIPSIVTEPNSGLLDDCINSIRAFTYTPHRIIVQSSKESAAFNRNRALEHTTAELVCFMDDDVWVTPNWDVPLLAAINGGGFQAAGPMIRLESGKIFSAGIGFVTPDEFFPLGYGRAYSEECQFPQEVFGLPTTCMIIKREAIEDLRFDERYESCQWEDIDFLLKLKSRGVRFAYCGESNVFHKNLFRTDSNARNRRLFQETWSPILAKRPATRLNHVRVVADALAEPSFPIIEELRKVTSGKPHVARFNGVWGSEILRYCRASEYEAFEALKKESWASNTLASDHLAPAALIDLVVIGELALTTQELLVRSSNIYSSSYINRYAAIAFAELHNRSIQYASSFHRMLLTKHDLWSGGFHYLSKQMLSRERGDQELCALVLEELQKRYCPVGSAEIDHLALLHGDPSPSNFVMRECGGETVGTFIDWAESCIGDPVLDLAKHVAAFGIDGHLRDEFLHEYNSHARGFSVRQSALDCLVPICRVFNQIVAPLLNLYASDSSSRLAHARLRANAWLRDSSVC